MLQLQYNLKLFYLTIFILVQITRGPAFGTRGKIVLPFEDNPSSKIGVRFDKPIPDGVNFGGLCDDGHGFFCKGIAHMVLLSFSFIL